LSSSTPPSTAFSSSQVSDGVAPWSSTLGAVGVLRGAFVFLSDLARHISLPLEIDFVCAASYGSATRSSGEVRLTKKQLSPTIDRGSGGPVAVRVRGETHHIPPGSTQDFLL